MDLICPRCGSPLHLVDGSPAPFCSHCGLPRLRVSDDALSQASPALQQEDSAGTLEWPRALRSLAVVAAIGVAVPCVLPGALASGSVSGVSLLLTPVLALAAVFSYGRGRPQQSTSTTAGARIGAVLGLMMGAAIAFVTGVAGFVLRYGYRSHAMDDTIGQAISQVPAQLAAQMGSAGPPPPELLAFIASPEFRAGSFIAGHVLSLLLLVGVASVCGWMSAAIFRTRREPEAE